MKGNHANAAEFGLPVLAEHIPSDLKALKRWVLWRASPRKGTPGKMDKRPYRPDGTPASKTTSAHWSDFSTVWAAYERGGFNGIGICLTADLGIVGVDFDRCIDADGVLSDAAQDAIARLNTYTERSPSGRGIRMLAYGAIERNFNNQDAGVEMYHDGAFLTITGHIL